MKIALVSLNQVWQDKTVNQRNCAYFIQKASELESDLIVFPEMTLTGFSMDTRLIEENQEDSQTVDFFRNLAKSKHISIAFGVVFAKGNKATNNMVLVNNEGEVLASYSKIHPFSFSGENNYYSGGDKLCSCEIADANIGLSICYDLRFPEIFQYMSRNCNLILTIANWPEKRIRHWNVLLQARSIENQCFMIGVNRTGIDGNNLSYIKSSVVFDPIGEQLTPLHTIQEMDIYNIQPSNSLSVRELFPLKNDRRTDLYKALL